MAKKALAPSQAVSTRDPKGRKFMSIVGAAYDKAGLSNEEAQRINDTPGLSDLVKGFIQENRCPDEYQDEEVASNYGYLSGYTVPKPVDEQVNILGGFFPHLDRFFELSVAADILPAGAEGYFAIPRWERIAPTYGEAVKKVLDLIKQTRSGRFYNYHEGQFGPQYLRQHGHTVEKMKELTEQQMGRDILIVPAQFGFRHRGRSVRRARETMPVNEFGLDAFLVGIMLLTHPERLQHYKDLRIDCAGDEFAPEAGGGFRSAPYFDFSGGRVRFDARYTGDANESCGSASAFLP